MICINIRFIVIGVAGGDRAGTVVGEGDGDMGVGSYIGAPTVTVDSTGIIWMCLRGVGGKTGVGSNDTLTIFIRCLAYGGQLSDAK